MLSMDRTPLNTRLLNGHETNSRFGSRSTTSMVGSFSRTYLATVAPPHPPPMTATRGPRFGMMSPFAVLAHPESHERDAPARSPRPAPDVPRNSLRVDRIVTLPRSASGTRQRSVVSEPGKEGSGSDRLLHAGEQFLPIPFEMHGRRQRRRRGLDAGAREDHEHARARVDLPAVLHADQRSHGRRAFRRGPD